MTINVVSGRKMPGHHRRATGGTDPASHREAVEVGTFFGEAVEVGRPGVGAGDVERAVRALDADVAPAPVCGRE